MNDLNSAEKDIDTLEREVNEKRANLDRTLEAVEQQLSPSQLIDQTMGYFKEHGGDMTQSIGRSIKDNPLPLVLTGVGLAWLMASQSSGRSAPSNQYSSHYRDRLVNGYDDRYHPTDSQQQGYYRTSSASFDNSSPSYPVSKGSSTGDDESLIDDVKETVGQWSDQAAEMRESIAEKVQLLKQDAGETAEQWQKRTETTLNDMQQSAYNAGQSARQSAIESRQNMRHSVYDAGQIMQARSKQMGNWFQEQPLVTGALGIAVGALVGSLIPPTRVEDDLVGASADSVRSSMAGEVLSKVSEAREQVEDSADNVATEVQKKADSITSESATT